MTNHTCKVYGNVSKMSDNGLEHAWNTNIIRMRWSADNAAFKGLYTKDDFIEAMACLILETDYRWENGGKQAFDEMIQRTFGRKAVTS